MISPVEQIGDRGKPDMRMRAHVEALAAAEFDRAHLVEKNERADHAALRRRQRATHLESRRDRWCAARSLAQSHRKHADRRPRGRVREKSSCAPPPLPHGCRCQRSLRNSDADPWKLPRRPISPTRGSPRCRNRRPKSRAENLAKLRSHWPHWPARHGDQDPRMSLYASRFAHPRWRNPIRIVRPAESRR